MAVSLGALLAYIVVAAGTWAIAKRVYALLLVLWRKLFNRRVDVRRCGRFAVVTGATDGIGREFAYQLAAQGLSVMLIARDAARLQRTAAEIETLFPVQAPIFRLDFATATPEDFARLRQRLRDVGDIGVLVNNVGMSYDCPAFFDELPALAHRRMLAVNCSGLVEVTHAVLPLLLPKRRGVILNVGSLLGLQPAPLMSTYSATKAFVAAFSSALHGEYSRHGILVQACCPGMVATKMCPVDEPSLFVPPPEVFVQAALAGLRWTPAVSVPYWPHRLQAYLGTIVPVALRDALTFEMHQQLRAEAGAKKAE